LEEKDLEKGMKERFGVQTPMDIFNKSINGASDFVTIWPP